MSVFIEEIAFLSPPSCLQKSLKSSANLTASREWWAQWWAHLTCLTSSDRSFWKVTHAAHLDDAEMRELLRPLVEGRFAHAVGVLEKLRIMVSFP